MTLSIPVQAQRELFLLGGLGQSAINYNYTFREQGAILNRGWNDNPNYSVDMPWFNLALQYRYSRNFLMEAGFQLMEMDLAVNDSRFLAKYPSSVPAPSGCHVDGPFFDLWRYYNSPYLAGYYLLNPPSHDATIVPYVGCGVAFNYLGAQRSGVTASYLDVNSNESLELNSHFVPCYLTEFLECGIHGTMPTSPGHDHCFSLGVKFYYAGNVVSGDYRDQKGGTTLYTDHVEASGSHLTLTFRYGIGVTKRTVLHDSSVARAHEKAPLKPKPEAHPWIPNKLVYERHSPLKPPHLRKAKRRKAKAKSEKKDSDNSRGW